MVPALGQAATFIASNDAEFAQAISQATDGDTIKLAPGNYGRVLLISGQYNQIRVGGTFLPNAAPVLNANVTIESQDPNNRAVIHNIDIRSDYWTFNDVAFALTPAGQYFYAAKFTGNNNRLTNSVITYGDSTGWSASDWINNAGRGVYIRGTGNQASNNYMKNIGAGIIVDHGSSNTLVRRNTIKNLAGDAVQAHGHHTLIEKNLFMNFKSVDANHDDCIQSFSKQGGVIGAGSVVGMTIRGNLCVSNEDPNDPFYSGNQGYVIFNGMADDWLIEDNVLVSSTYHGISLTSAKNSTITHNTVLDDNPSLNGANTVWIRILGAGIGNEVSNNIANVLIANPNVTFSNNETINLSEYDDWFVDWQNYNFDLKETAPNQTVGASLMDPGASFDPYAVPLPASLPLFLGGIGLAGVIVLQAKRRKA